MSGATKSTHVCEVIEVNLERHPNADSLSLCRIFGGGYTCIMRTEDWKDIKRAIYVVPDSLVDTTRTEFSFLAGEKRLYEVEGRKVYARIKAKKLRGIVSFGLCIPAPEEALIGEDWADKLGIVHFDETEHQTTSKGLSLSGGEIAVAPKCHFIYYDVDSLRRYKNAIEPGEMVAVVEKVDGENSRYLYHDDEMHCGSHGQWKREFSTKPNYEEIERRLREKLTTQLTEEEILSRLSEIKAKLDNFKPSQSKWWIVYNQNEGIQKFCRDNPGQVLYGEIFGHTNRLKYNLDEGKIRFAAFDILKDGKFLNYQEFVDVCASYNITTAPLIDIIPYDFEKVCELAEGPSLVKGAACIREGCVVHPLQERYDYRLGRICFKIVSSEFLEKVK